MFPSTTATTTHSHSLNWTGLELKQCARGKKKTVSPAWQSEAIFRFSESDPRPRGEGSPIWRTHSDKVNGFGLIAGTQKSGQPGRMSFFFWLFRFFLNRIGPLPRSDFTTFPPSFYGSLVSDRDRDPTGAVRVGWTSGALPVCC